MSRLQTQVREFHAATGSHIAETPQIPPNSIIWLRLRLINEEFNELRKALVDKNIIEVADAIADLLYVVYGTAVSCGLEMGPICDEVHSSNMTKVAGPVIKDAGGKIQKPASYQPPNLGPIIREQRGTTCPDK